MAEADQKFSQKWVKSSGKVMHVVKDSRSRQGVCKVAKIGKERLTHGGSPKTLLLAVHICVSHGPHHLGLRVKSPERPKWIQEVCPEDRRLGRASTSAFALGAFCMGWVLTASQGQGLFASVTSQDTLRDKDIQEIMWEEFAPRLRPQFGVLVAIAFCKAQLSPCICQPCAKS